MAEGRIPGANVKIARFAKQELEKLVESLSNEAPDLRVEEGALMGALIHGALRSPPETVAALLSTYWGREAEAAAVAAVVEFIASLA